MKELQRQLLVAIKSSFKAAICFAAGYASFKLTGSWAVGAPVMAIFAPILKVIDPKDNSMGFNLTK